MYVWDMFIVREFNDDHDDDDGDDDGGGGVEEEHDSQRPVKQIVPLYFSLNGYIDNASI